jgi:hypothetical protein
MMKGENHIKKDFWSWSVFLTSEYWLSLYLKRLLELFFFFLFFLFLSFSFFSFFNTFSLSFFYAPSLEDLGVLMIFEEKITSSKTFFSNGLTWNGMVLTVDILAVDAYSGMELCMPI